MEHRKSLELPDWIKPFVESQINEQVTNKVSVQRSRVESLLRSRLKPEKNSTWCNKFYEIAQYCEKLLNRAETNNIVLGLDLDWPNAYKSIFKAKKVHICCGEGECAVFNISELSTVPKAFTLLLKHSNVKLVGFNILKDLIKLGKNFSFQVEDLIAKLEDPNKFVEEKLSCCHQWSIKSVIEKGFDSFEKDAENTEPLIEKFEFKGFINFTNTLNDCGAVCEKLLRIVKYFPEGQNLVFGFDVEWPFTFKAGLGNGKVALIQMCPEDRICFLFHVAFFSALPKSLVLLLKHPRVKLSGLNIANDLRKIGRDFRIDVTDIIKHQLIELSSLANKKLSTCQRWSLDGLVLNQLNLTLEKPKDVRISNWAADQLNKEQIIYAASDAYASLTLYNHLMDSESPNILAMLH